MRRLSDRYRFGVTSPHTKRNAAILFSFRASEHSIRRLQKLLDRLTLFDQDKQKVRHLRRLTTAAREIVRNSRHSFHAHGTISNAIVVSRKELLKGQLKASTTTTSVIVSPASQEQPNELDSAFSGFTRTS